MVILPYGLIFIILEKVVDSPSSITEEFFWGVRRYSCSRCMLGATLALVVASCCDRRGGFRVLGVRSRLLVAPKCARLVMHFDVPVQVWIFSPDTVVSRRSVLG